MMRKLATIFLLLIFASSFTELGQLWKLPVLVQHFNNHRQAEGASVRHFILEHYGNDHQDPDRAQDQQLPFKTPLNTPGVNVVPCIAKIEFVPVQAPSAPRFVLLHTSFVPSPLAGQIFHPPRTV